MKHRIVIIIEHDSAGVVTDVYGPDNYSIDDTAQAAVCAVRFLHGETQKANLVLDAAKELLSENRAAIHNSLPFRRAAESEAEHAG